MTLLKIAEKRLACLRNGKTQLRRAATMPNLSGNHCCQLIMSAELRKLWYFTSCVYRPNTQLYYNHNIFKSGRQNKQKKKIFFSKTRMTPTVSQFEMDEIFDFTFSYLYVKSDWNRHKLASITTYKQLNTLSKLFNVTSHCTCHFTTDTLTQQLLQHLHSYVARLRTTNFALHSLHK